MRRYSERAKRLGECKLIRETLGLNVKLGEKRGQTGVTHAGDERDRSHFLITFRPLYLPSEVNGFPQVAALIREHAEQRGGEEASKAAEMIAEYEERHHEALATSNVLEVRVEGGERVVSPEELFKLWLYGDAFHEDERKIEYLEGLHPIERSTFEFSYLATATTLARMYCRFATFPNAILHEPSLLPAG